MNTTKIKTTTFNTCNRSYWNNCIINRYRNPALAKSNNGNSVSKSDIRDVGKFLQCIAHHGGNDISKKQAQRCVDDFLG
jgi:hypothetical protein